jgi:glycosyltransferase involved in cell wall biosynthesis
MLEPWSLGEKKWKKRLAMWLYQRRDLERAVALHATAESEAEQFRRLGFKQPIVVLPNGVDFPAKIPPRIRRADGGKTILFLSRIHPKKGLIDLVEAWRKIREGCCGWHVEYAGPDSGGHLGEVQERIQKMGLAGDFTYLGDLDDHEKWSAYRSADLFVLPTHSENFGIVVAEALAAGVPVITTKGAPWAELEGIPRQDGAVPGRAGWWIDIGAEPLAEALREAMGLTDGERCAMGENGRRLVEAKYTWPAVAERMKAAYITLTK